MSELALAVSNSLIISDKDQITLISSDNQEFITTKTLLGVHSTFFSSLFESAASSDNRYPLTENGKDVALFLEAIQRSKESYSFEDATSLMLMGDKYDCWILRYVAKLNLLYTKSDQTSYTYPIEMIWLAAKIGDATLGNLVAKSCTRYCTSSFTILNFDDRRKWSPSALSKFNDLDRTLSQKLIFYHQGHKQAIMRMIANDYEGNTTCTNEKHSSGKFDSSKTIDVIKNVLPLYRETHSVVSILRSLIPTYGCDSCDSIEAGVLTHYTPVWNTWKEEIARIPLPF